MLLPLNRTLCAAGLPLRNHVADVADVDDVANVIERRRGVVRAHAVLHMFFPMVFAFVVLTKFWRKSLKIISVEKMV